MRGPAMFAAFPLLALPVLLYNLIALMGGAATPTRLAGEIATFEMASDAVWSVSVGDLLLSLALVVLFVELLKSANSRRVAIINHGLSLVLFVICLIEFLLGAPFATSVFFLLTVMVLLDVLAGFIVSIVAARRDVGFGG